MADVLRSAYDGTTMREHTIFRRIGEGDWNAFGALFDGYSEQLFHYALGFLRNNAAAKDIVQDVFVWLWTNRGGIAYKGPVYPYLRRAVKNACINHRLHEKVEERYLRERMAGAPDEGGGDGQEDEHDELCARLRSVMDGLPPKCREIFILGCADGMSYSEIAGKLDISVNTVKTQMKTAYRKIRDNRSHRR